MEKIEIDTGGEKVEAEVADTLLSKSKGLSFRSEGKMLFVFSLGKPLIDMMFLSKPLFLYFLDGEKRVVDVQRAEPWGWNPKTWRLYRPEKKSKYLLESFENLELEEGETLEFEI